MKSNRVIFAKFVFLLNFVLFANGTIEGPVFRCESSDYRPSSTCQTGSFKNLHLTSTYYDWQPIVYNPTHVNEVNFDNCTIPVVTNNICGAFPILTYLYLDSSAVKDVKEDAFNGCGKLKTLDLRRNHIEELHENVFAPLKHLNALYLQENKLKTLNFNLFSRLHKLVALWLNKNYLTNFPPQLLRSNTELHWLWLNSNDLSDVDVEQIRSNTPYLKYFNVDDNDISCTRMEQILGYFKKHYIRTKPTKDNYGIRRYRPRVINGEFKCRPDNHY